MLAASEFWGRGEVAVKADTHPRTGRPPVDRGRHSTEIRKSSLTTRPVHPHHDSGAVHEPAHDSPPRHPIHNGRNARAATEWQQ